MATWRKSVKDRDQQSILFSILPKRAVADARLSQTAFRLLLLMCFEHRRKRGDQCALKRADLVQRIGCNKATISKLIHYLSSWGYVHVSPHEKDRRRNVYEVLYGRNLSGKVPLRAAYDETMQWKELRTLVSICCFDFNRGHGCFASNSTIAEKANLREGDVKRALLALSMRGYIRIETRADGIRRIVVIHNDRLVADLVPQAQENGSPHTRDRSPEVQNRSPALTDNPNGINGVEEQVYFNEVNDKKIGACEAVKRLSAPKERASQRPSREDQNDAIVEQLAEIIGDHRKAWSQYALLDDAIRDELHRLSREGSLNDATLLNYIRNAW